MKTQYLQNWKFWLEGQNGPDTSANLPGDPWAPAFDDSGWENVVVPHDWAVGFPFSKDYSSGTGYLPGGTGWYRAVFNISPFKGSLLEGKKAFLTFEGVYKNSQVWCNGSYLGKRPNGYIGFTYDISHCIREGRNVIAVKVSHEDYADSRWYTGSGIYRRVLVEFREAAHIPLESIVVKTSLQKDAGSPAEIFVSGMAVNQGSGEAENTFVRAVLEGNNGEKLNAEAALEPLAPGASLPFDLKIRVPNPRLWSAGAPNLYCLYLELKSSSGGEMVYTTEVFKVGIRAIRFDPDQGFFINGKNEKLKGVCFHHDSGCLGAAFWPDVWRRRLEKLKKAGCNAVRTSHNPQSPELYDLCDEMGFYVMDEAFDEWEGCKNKWRCGHNVYPPVHQGYYEDFPQWHERDLADMVIRDRNHPSVIMWSIGNEIDYPNDPYVHPLFAEMAGNNDANKPKQEQLFNPDKPNMERLAVIARELAAIVKRYDTTRPVISAAAFPDLSSRLGFLDYLDVAGYNYREQFYEKDHQRFPKLPLLGSENSHHLAAWKAVQDNDYISGQFLWTGIDYLGEAKGWPIRGSEPGLLDMAGNEKITWYRRKSFWMDDPILYLAVRTPSDSPVRPEPWIRELFRSWNFPKGKNVEVICYTNLPQAELFLNGKSLGIKKRDDDREYLSWIVPFERGKLEARGIDEGLSVSSFLESNQPPVSLSLRQWKPDLPVLNDASVLTGEWNLAQIEIEVQDENNALCVTASPLVNIAVSGGGKLLGLENGDIADCQEYAAPYRRVFRGRLIAYVLVPTGAGEKIFVEAASEGLTGMRLEL